MKQKQDGEKKARRPRGRAIFKKSYANKHGIDVEGDQVDDIEIDEDDKAPA